MSSSSQQSRIRSAQVEETEAKSSDFVWEAEYQDKMTILKNSISQVPSSERRQINFQFIDDMKATFDFKSLHSKKKKPPPKPNPADKPPVARKDRKGAVKPPEAANAANGNKKRRPRNAFILYRTVLQAKAEFKGKTQTELSRLIAACWQNEPPETRAYFERAAELEKGSLCSTRTLTYSLRIRRNRRLQYQSWAGRKRMGCRSRPRPQDARDAIPRGIRRRDVSSGRLCRNRELSHVHVAFFLARF
jgi:hypothetical protein